MSPQAWQVTIGKFLGDFGIKVSLQMTENPASRDEPFHSKFKRTCIFKFDKRFYTLYPNFWLTYNVQVISYIVTTDVFPKGTSHVISS